MDDGCDESRGNARGRQRKNVPPLDEQRLRDLALNYLSRYATSRMKLARYLSRKLRERGWAGERPADVDALLNRLEELQYLDDAAYAAMRGASLSRRGYGKRRIVEDLGANGIDRALVDDLVTGAPEENEDTAAEGHWGALAHNDGIDHVMAAIKLAKRRRLGPFATGSLNGDPRVREKAIATLVRAGHSFALAKHIVDQPIDTTIDAIIGDAPLQ